MIYVLTPLWDICNVMKTKCQMPGGKVVFLACNSRSYFIHFYLLLRVAIPLNQWKLFVGTKTLKAKSSNL